MGTLGWIVSTVGVLGVAGTIALAVFAPLVLAQTFRALMTVLESILSTRIGVGILVGIACLVIGELHGDWTGSGRVQAKWDEARRVAKAEADAKDTNISEAAKKTDKENSAAEVAVDQADKESRDAYIKELEQRATGVCRDVCRDTDADIERLRSLR